MPYRLIQELTKLCKIEVAVKKDQQDVDLTDPARNLSDAGITQIDKIDHLTKVTFGRNKEPSPSQKRIMEKAGFPCEAVEKDSAGWTIGAIHTPIGKLRY